MIKTTALAPEVIRLIFYFAHMAANRNFDERQRTIYDSDGNISKEFSRHRSALFNKYKSRITIGACRGSALRTSLKIPLSFEFQGGGRRRTKNRQLRRKERDYDDNGPIWADNRRGGDG
mmetsp:Transcript_29251/g.59946  ORF Transcript_29251/g.59946 Transcript_29251/m.59946 type:complete len:119 (+) Transcript_29251:1196-1552(+)